MTKTRQFSYRLGVQGADKVEQAFLRVGTAAQTGLSKVDSSVVTSAKSMTTLAKRQEELTKTTINLQKSTKGLAGEIKKFVTVAAIAALTKEIIDVSLAFDRVEIGLKNVFGSSANAAKEMQFVRTEAERLGLPLLALADGYKSLAASTRDTSLEGALTKEIFTGLTEAASVYRLSQEQVNGVFKAYTDMISKGNVQMEELKGQLGDRLPGVLRLAAKGLGLTTAELVKLVSTGKLAADKFLPAFTKALKEDVAGGLEDSAKSSQAAFNRMNNGFTELAEVFADAGFIDAVMTFTAVLTDFFGSDVVSTGARELGALFKQISAEGDIGKTVSKWVDQSQAGFAAIRYGAEIVSKEEMEALGKQIEDYERLVALHATQGKAPPLPLPYSVRKRFESGLVGEALTDKLAGDSGFSNNITRINITKGVQKSDATSRAAQDFIGDLKKDIDAVASDDRVKRKLEDEKSLKLAIQRIERDTAKEQKENAEQNVVFTEEQREAVARLITQRSSALAQQKKEKAFQGVSKGVNKEFATLTNSFEANMVVIDNWKKTTLSALDEQDSRYKAFAGTVEALYKDKIQKAQEEFIKSSEGMSGGFQRAVLAMRDQTTTIADDIENAFTRLSKGVSDELAAMVLAGKLDFESLGNVAMSVLQQIASAMLERSIVAPLLGMLAGGGGGAGGLIGSLFKFADGGYVDRPTPFSFGGGKMGVRGEAGGEFIMPAVRGPDGKMGVRSSGSKGGVVVNQSITIDARGADSNVDQKIMYAMHQNKEQTKAEIMAEMQGGGSMSRLVGKRA